MATYLDSQGNPIATQAARPPVYLDDSGNPKQPPAPEKPSLVSDALKYSPVGMIKVLADTIRTAGSDILSGKNPLSRVTDAAQENAKMLDRAKTQIGWAEDDFKKGNYAAALNNGAAAALHFVNYLAPGGSAAEDIGTDFQNKDYARGLLKTAGLASTVAAQQKAPAVIEAAIDPNLPGNVAAGAKGAVKGAVGAATADAHFRGISVPGGNVMAGAVGGGAAARALGLPTEAGAIIGGGAPIVRGAVTGARTALAERAAAQTAELSRTPTFQPRALLPAGPVVTPAPPDPSFVRAASLEEINPQMAAQVGNTTYAAPPVPSYEGVPIPALNEMAVKSGFKGFEEVPKDYQPILANLTRVELEKQAHPPPTQPAPATQPAPVVPQSAPVSPQPPAPTAIITKADIAKRALADEMLKSGSATPEMLGDPASEPLVPDAKALKTLMRDLPPGGPRAIANANYAGNQEPTQAAAVYEAAGRAEKSQALSQMLYDEGLSSRQVSRWSPKAWAAATDDRGMATAFSKESQGEVIQMLKKLEKTVPKK